MEAIFEWIDSTSEWGAVQAVTHAEVFCLMALVAAASCVLLVVEQLRDGDRGDAAAYAAFAAVAAAAAALAWTGRVAQLSGWFAASAKVGLVAVAVWVAWAVPQVIAGAKDARETRDRAAA